MASTAISPSLTTASSSSSSTTFCSQNLRGSYAFSVGTAHANRGLLSSRSLSSLSLKNSRKHGNLNGKSKIGGRGIGVMCSAGTLPQALLFDCDGVLVDTEKDGHRISFNDTFAERDLGVTWDVDLYGELLKIGGGKERMTAYFNKVGWPEKAPKSEEKERNL